MEATVQTDIKGNDGVNIDRMIPDSVANPGNFKALFHNTYQDNANSPFHGYPHAETIWSNAEILIERCKQLGIEINERALKVAILFHDSLTHVDAKLLGFKSAEHLAAHVAYQFLIQEGWPEKEARLVEQLIIKTNPFEIPSTPEEIIIRAADLWNLGQHYSIFSAATFALHKETEIRRQTDIPFDEWLARGYKYLRLFLWPMLELTPQARDEESRSVWHIKAADNTATLWRETYPSSQVIVECIEDKPSTVRSPDNKQVIYYGLHSSQDKRREIIGSVDESLPEGSCGFIIPGDAESMSIPDNFCDELLLHSASDRSINEAFRVLRDGGVLTLHILTQDERAALMALRAIPQFTAHSVNTSGKHIVYKIRKSREVVAPATNSL